jgi:ribA/ribD-fused uncharacterized protein
MAIDRFDGEYHFLSNFYPVSVFGYPSVENAYQAAKTLNREERLPFRECSPAQAKKLGRRLVLRPDWEDRKLEIMRVLVRKKFEHPELRQRLLETGNQDLIEGNCWGDRFWGVCRGEGKNHLGQILMEVRRELRGEDPSGTR